MIAFRSTIHPERATEAKIAVSMALDHSSNFYRKRSRRIETLNDSGPRASEGGPASILLLEHGTASCSQMKPIKPHFPTAPDLRTFFLPLSANNQAVSAALPASVGPRYPFPDSSRHGDI